MNLFFLDLFLNPCASSACDKHVIKMILETAQILYAAWHSNDIMPPSKIQPYRKTHVNHPMARWIRRAPGNYIFACYYGLLLCAEYTRRYGKYHKTEEHLRQLLAWGFPPKIQESISKKLKPVDYAHMDIPHGITPIPLCMDPEYYVRDSFGNLLGVESYRNYYRSKRDKFSMTWKNSTVPSWF